MSKTLLIRPEANNSVTVLLDGVEFRLMRDGAALLVAPPESYEAVVSEGGIVSIRPAVEKTAGGGKDGATASK